MTGDVNKKMLKDSLGCSDDEGSEGGGGEVD